MSIKIALAGNPNSGKTTLFNTLTGSNQYVGNWPGVTVEKKEGNYKKNSDVIFTDLPGLYSLSPYTLEEVVTRKYLINERPDAILNIVDGTNLERNLYLTTQLIEIGIPVVIAINMMDVVRKNGDKIDLDILSRGLECPIVEISALKGDGVFEAAEKAIEAAELKRNSIAHIFSGTLEHAIAHIEEATVHSLPEDIQRWYAVKIFERDQRVVEHLKISDEILKHIENDIKRVEEKFDDDAESIITNERYVYITELTKRCLFRKNAGRLSVSDKIDNIVTNRILALPIFIVAMWLVYYLSIGSIGAWSVDFMNEKLFGEWIIPNSALFLEKIGCMPWLVSLISDGILGGVGAVLGFVPQMLILFALLALLEDCGYMSRVAFIMDKIFRKFGLSGKSFIPLLVATGCTVPGVMSSRTIEQDRDRKITIMTTGFIPCGAKMPIVAMVAGAMFGGSAWVATGAYFIGIMAVVISGLILKKSKAFNGNPAPFVMELPSYHAPVPLNVLRTTWERGWSFIKKAGTIILAASVIIWILNNITFEGGFGYIGDREVDSVLNIIGSAIAVIFKPLGFGQWQSAVATILGLVAKEEVVAVFGSLSQNGNAEIALNQVLGGNAIAGFSFLVFNLLCAPCFAAMGAIKREMNNYKWTIATISYMCVFAYAVSLMIYQFGMFITTGLFTLGTTFALITLGILIFLILRKDSNK